MDAANVDLKGFTEDFYQASDALAPGAGEGHAPLARARVERLDRDHEPDHSAGKRFARRAEGDVRLDSGGPRPECAGALHGVSSRFSHAGPRATRRPKRCWRRTTSPCGAACNYAYVGNIQAPKQQTTYCPGCKQPLIERVGYTITRYDLNQQSLPALRHDRLPAITIVRPATWGSRRQPVRISEFEVRPQPRVWHCSRAAAALLAIPSLLPLLPTRQRAEPCPPAAACRHARPCRLLGQARRRSRKRPSSDERRPGAGGGGAGPRRCS